MVCGKGAINHKMGQSSAMGGQQSMLKLDRWNFIFFIEPSCEHPLYSLWRANSSTVHMRYVDISYAFKYGPFLVLLSMKLLTLTNYFCTCGNSVLSTSSWKVTNGSSSKETYKKLFYRVKWKCSGLYNPQTPTSTSIAHSISTSESPVRSKWSLIDSSIARKNSWTLLPLFI